MMLKFTDKIGQPGGNLLFVTNIVVFVYNVNHRDHEIHQLVEVGFVYHISQTILLIPTIQVFSLIDWNLILLM